MNELFSTLGIDVRLLVVQLVNFGILVFLLTKFLYKPLLGVLNNRKKMAKDMAEEAKNIAETKRNLNKEIEEERNKIKKEADQILAEARGKIEVQRADAVAQLEKDLITMKNRALAEIENERLQAMNEAKSQLASAVILAAEKVLEREVKGQDSMKLAQEALDKIK